MTYELRLERLFDAPPEVVFDTLVDPDAQQELFADPAQSMVLLESKIDLRVGGTWTVIGERGGEPYDITYVFTEIERPHRLASTMSMTYGDPKRTDNSTVSFTFEDQGGKTLVTLVQGGFATEEERDDYLSGAPGFLDAFQKAVSSRVAG